MSNLTLYGETSQAITLPPPRVAPISIRVATLADMPFIDGLQKQHTKMVGWFPRQQLENYIKSGFVVIAEESDEATEARSDGGEDAAKDDALRRSVAASLPRSPLGYCISRDQYFKRDDCGIIYQLNVLPGKQRGLIGATLIKAVFDRAAYGCKLFCCWCAQDLEANHFWESLGFVPLAFRTGGRGKGPQVQRKPGGRACTYSGSGGFARAMSRRRTGFLRRRRRARSARRAWRCRFRPARTGATRSRRFFRMCRGLRM